MDESWLRDLREDDVKPTEVAFSQRTQASWRDSNEGKAKRVEIVKKFGLGGVEENAAERAPS